MKRPFIISAAFFFLVTFLVATAATNARVFVGNLAGTVTNAEGAPVAGATVTIQTSDGQHPRATRTDASGHFEFTRFEIGQYDLRAYFHGSYSDWAKRIVIHAHKPTQITLRIRLPKH